MTEINKYITADPEICHGKPVFKGTRIMIWQILEMLSVGETNDEILEAFPSLSQNHIKAALKFASRISEGQRFFSFAPKDEILSR